MKKYLPFLICLAVAAGCQSLPIKKKPEARFQKVEIKSLSLKDVTLQFDLAISNPYPVRLKLESADLTFFLEGKRLFKTRTGKGLKIKARGTQVSSLDVTLKYKDIIRAVKNYSRKDYLKLRVDAVVALPLPKIPGVPPRATFKYTLNTKIPAIKPEIRIANFKVKMPSKKDITRVLNRERKKLNPGKVYGMFNDILRGRKPKKVIDPSSLDLPLKVSFDIIMQNKTRAALKFTRLDYTFMVNRSKLVDGKTSAIKNAGNRSVLSIQNSFSTRALSASILKAFRSRRGAFLLRGEALLKLPDVVKKAPLKLKFNETGTFRL